MENEHRRLYSLDELLAEHLPIGRTLLFSEIKAGRLQTVHIGRRTLVTSNALQNYIALLETEDPPTEDVGPEDRADATGTRGLSRGEHAR